MGNCSLRAVTDAAQEEAVRTTSSSALNSFTTTTTTTTTNGKTSVEVLPPPRNGVWKVKLVIDPRDLEQILSEEVNTEALIEQMRIAANSTPKRGKSSWGGVVNEAISYKCVCSSDQNVQPRRHLR
ncbi:hypothetical protein Pfo_010501 [Paulownia fortunei]|nr:hypothetical protein Pfo_010501 [Paulownia fortunei]